MPIFWPFTSIFSAITAANGTAADGSMTIFIRSQINLHRLDDLVVGHSDDSVGRALGRCRK